MERKKYQPGEAMMRQDTIILLSGVWSYPTVMSGLLGLESLWLLAQSLRVVNDLLIMICLHGIYTYNKYKQQWVVYFKKMYVFHCQVIIIC